MDSTFSQDVAESDLKHYIDHEVTDRNDFVKVSMAFIRFVMPDLSGSAVKVYLSMNLLTWTWSSEHDTYVRSARPLSVRFLAQSANLNPKSVMKALDELRDKKLITCTKPGDRDSAAEYKLNTRIWIREYDQIGTYEIVDTADEGGPKKGTPEQLAVPKKGTPEQLAVPKKGTGGVPKKGTNLIDLDLEKNNNDAPPVDVGAALSSTRLSKPDRARTFVMQERENSIFHMVNALVGLTLVPAMAGDRKTNDYHNKLRPAAEALIDSGCSPEQIETWYGKSNRPSYWWDSHWKGEKKNQRPSPEDIRSTWLEASQWRPADKAGSIKVAADNTAALASWEVAVKAAGQFGSYRSLDEWATLNEIQREAVKRFGKRDLCMLNMTNSYEVNQARAKFVGIYVALVGEEVAHSV